MSSTPSVQFKKSESPLNTEFQPSSRHSPAAYLNDPIIQLILNELKYEHKTEDLEPTSSTTNAPIKEEPAQLRDDMIKTEPEDEDAGINDSLLPSIEQPSTRSISLILHPPKKPRRLRLSRPKYKTRSGRVCKPSRRASY